MPSRPLTLLSVALAGLLLAACGKSEEQKQQEQFTQLKQEVQAENALKPLHALQQREPHNESKGKGYGETHFGEPGVNSDGTPSTTSGLVKTPHS